MTVAWGFLGAGWIAQRAMAPAVSAAPNARLVATASSDPSRAALLGPGAVHRSYDDLVSDPAVDVVYIALANHQHAEWAIRALQAGKHVLCEKPLAMNSKESGDLVARAKAAGVQCGVNYNIRYYPVNLDARAKVQSGATGPVHSVAGSYVQDWLLFDTDYNWRVLDSEGGSLRAVADIGTHWLDLVQFISGQKVVKVLADLKTVHPKRKRPLGEVETFAGPTAKVVPTEEIDIRTEDQGAVMLRFDGGATGVLWVSQATAGRKNRLSYEIAGSQRAMAWDSENPNEVWIGSRSGPNEVLVKDPGLLSEDARGFAGYPGGHAEGYPDSFKGSFKAFYAAVRGETSVPYATFADGHREIALCEAVEKSNKSQQWTEVEA